MNEPRNPYAPPAAQVVHRDENQPAEPGRFIPYGRLLSANRGVVWIGDAWRMLKAQPAMWAASLVLMLIAFIVLSLIPVVSFFVQFIGPFAYAGIALAADQQRRTGTFELKTLVGGFDKHVMPLLAVGVATFVAGLIFLIVIAGVLGGDVFRMITHGFDPDPSSVMTLKFWLAVLIGLALMLPVIAATYLAPQLIVLHDQPAMEAMKMSLVATAKNILPGLVFGICAFLLLLVSMIPLLLGLLITAPIMMITNYTVYRDIFVED